ncbi:UDP-N-acetylmuramoyl-L-alanyl-D-glutamate--2,6-diaminopimelate ligase [Chitinophaga sancti]|uniref:UDP-N-acetylmuramoyl-L-alanyl-D-glutamate--2,6-diaminopimelate ligase n=1 Tax=Chitinophaga sancti TaxID=1004 RepID=A0A1K1PCI2_9BACT|nr:UDP-N-acetylmuramoyl-L-alanyl-D-glutamate--2,6-diaminopimelate ligase [Chitinophaga sancti]WQD65756.1 UDP-N-acetylmuramoyl-L-alanyl-D-glutamate--2,6-diaminopimelate ligase [Chitinophaga sancti]WQG88622.1 UDP-N-acetylmuramoyl-L-alanyl-D-glutamate--2,6-diaminopimelate ligase [Chitinophaga sancti]SFW45300.1 UDP-N-acetylmuramoylalanyl-D-glutamate--2,6-diaminopimelate ligase [Chitinophaga sancti]
MKTLRDILYNVNIVAVKGSTDTAVNALNIDSRAVKPGDAFIAIRGVHSDGHLFIDKAVQQGAAVVICEELPAQIADNVVYVQVSSSTTAAGVIAGNFYDNPSHKVQLVGVTGTNGKTTIATLLFKLFSALGYHCGMLSTVQNQIGDKIVPSTHTTPDPIHLNALLADMVNDGCDYVFMEVSSHAIHQQRIAGLKFAGGIFSNITHDHLDYHKTFDEYIRVKKSWFDGLPATAFALTNLDDKRGNVMLQNTKAKKQSYSLRTVADFKGKILENNLTGLIMMINETEVHFRLIGEFNAYNLLAVYGAATLLGQEKARVLQALSDLSGAEGRFDYIVSPHQRIIGIVDYAHTPDALLNVLATIKNLRKGNEQVITVVGCGGDRDTAKRPVMAEVAVERSDRVILTSDNPRSEDPNEIIKQMEAGVPVHLKKKVLSITDRKEAIKTAISLANPEDIILIAGKGHEKYQDIQGVKHPFDDKQVLEEMMRMMEK